MVEVFFSYSHRDENLRDELEIHLAMLKRQGVVSVWHDRRIGAGEAIQGAISEHLESAQIILLLVSPYFLASDYCYDMEMRRALERHNVNDACVIPIILEPCDWKAAPFGALRATPKDGKPVSKHPNMHDAFLEVVHDIRSAAVRWADPSEQRSTNTLRLQQTPAPEKEVRSSNLRVRREFTEKERDDFLAESFQYVRTFFENSLAELHRRNPEVEVRLNEVGKTQFTCTAYSRGKKASSCRIWLEEQGGFMDGICYANSDSGGSGAFSEALSVVDDGHALQLRPMGVMQWSHGDGGYLSKHGGAEHLWDIFVRPLQ